MLLLIIGDILGLKLPDEVLQPQSDNNAGRHPVAGDKSVIRFRAPARLAELPSQVGMLCKCIVVLELVMLPISAIRPALKTGPMIFYFGKKGVFMKKKYLGLAMIVILSVAILFFVLKIIDRQMMFQDQPAPGFDFIIPDNADFIESDKSNAYSG